MYLKILTTSTSCAHDSARTPPDAVDQCRARRGSTDEAILVEEADSHTLVEDTSVHRVHHVDDASSTVGHRLRVPVDSLYVRFHVSH